MNYVNEMYPSPLIDPEKHQLYLRLRAERDKLLKNMQEMSHLDWSIDKRLVEAGGRGNTIYILPARGGSRTNWWEIERLLKEGRDVRVVTTRKYEPKLYPMDRKTIQDAIFQLQLYSLLDKPWRDPRYEALWRQLFPEDTQNTRRELHAVNPYTDLASHWVYKSFEEAQECP